MNELYRSQMRLPLCGFPVENHHPSIRRLREPQTQMKFDPALPPEEYACINREIPNSILPYSSLDGYTRTRQTGELATLVLENNRLRATFIPSLGGRLWSLLDKRDERELLYSNTVLQFGRLALRNAWFSGGIEWNIGFRGHTPFTAADLFAARLTDDGRPVLRFYEWERVTGTPFQMDCFFTDDDSDFLFTAVKIVNPDAVAASTYWWSNTAFPETADTRVIVPTERAIIHSKDGINLVHPANHDGVDATYPKRVSAAIDYFYYMPKDTRPWEAAVQKDGCGLLCTSTNVMRGRKLFLWGGSQGGRHWPDFLSEPGRPYIEIQSGLAKTQLESVPMPPKSEFYWIESFGPISGDPAALHDRNYRIAMNTVAAEVERRLPESKIDEIAARARLISGRVPEAVLHHGSGWGALELRRRAADGVAPFEFAPNSYPESSLGDLQAPWLELLAGRLPAPAAIKLPSWQTSDAWYLRLQAAEKNLPGAAAHPWLQYQLAVNECKREKYDQALTRLERVSIPPFAISIIERVKACLYTMQKHPELALPAWERALHAEPGSELLLSEALNSFIEAGRAAEFLRHLPSGSEAGGRIKYLRAKTLLALGRIDDVAAILEEPFEVADMAEGEIGLSELWLELQTRLKARAAECVWDAAYHAAQRTNYENAIPWVFDFRMTATPGPRQDLS